MIQYYVYTVLVIINLLFYTRATGTGMGIARVHVRKYSYGCARNTATDVERIRL